MDNKEAAEVIAAIKKHEIDILKINAFDMAIKALEQEPCEDWYDVQSDEMTLGQARQAVKDLRKKLAECLEEHPCTDVISRQAVFDLIADYDLSMGQVVKAIHALPPVTPQPKMGKWIGHREHCENLGVMPSGLGAYEWCSNCGCGIDVIEWHRNNYNFCPNCGAKMEVEERNE